MLYFFLYINLFSFLQTSNSVIELSTWIHPSTTPQLRDDQFLMIDFWATWCGPCIKAMDHIAELNKVTGDKVAYISVSKEHKEIVESFFSKRSPKSFIAIDYEGKTFEKFKVESLPYSILLAPNGKVIWQGQPNEMNFEKIKSLTSQQNDKPIAVVKKIITRKEVKGSIRKKKSIEQNGINAFVSEADQPLTFHRMEVGCHKVDFSGKVVDIISSIMGVPKNNILFNNAISSSGYFTIDTCINEDNKYTVLDLLMKGFKLKYEVFEEESDVYFMYLVDSTKLWSKDVYQWDENGNNNFLHTEFDLQADNYTLTGISSLLSRILNEDIRYIGVYNELHDWSMMLGDIDFMTTHLHQELGLKIDKKRALVTKIAVESK